MVHQKNNFPESKIKKRADLQISIVVRIPLLSADGPGDHENNSNYNTSEHENHGHDNPPLPSTVSWVVDLVVRVVGVVVI